MNKVAKLYTDAVKRHFRIFYANWEPGGPVELGDYGYLDGNIFIPMGNIRHDFDEFRPDDVIQYRADPSVDHKAFKSETGVQVNLGTKGSLSPQGIPLARASLTIKFSRKDAIFFNAAECTTVRIANKAQVGEILKHLQVSGQWERNYCLVTDLVKAKQTVIAVSQSSDSGITFEADSPAIDKINLADASVKFNLIAETNIGYKVNTDDGLDLLIGLCKFRAPIPWGDKAFIPKREPITEVEIGESSEHLPEVDPESDEQELVFEQLGDEK